MAEISFVDKNSDRYKNKIIIYHQGTFYYTFEDDAREMNKIFGYKLYENKKYNMLCLSFGNLALSKVKFNLRCLNKNYEIIEVNDVKEDSYDEESAPDLKRNTKYTLENINNGEIISYTIFPTHYAYEVVNMIGNRDDEKVFNEKIISDNDINQNEIIDETPVAKMLLKSSIGDIVKLLNDDLVSESYRVISIEAVKKK